MIITKDIIEFDGEQGRRSAFLGDYTIREVADGFDIYRNWSDGSVRVSCTDTLDEAVLYVNQMLGGIA